jgi:site-specific DNA recombinase
MKTAAVYCRVSTVDQADRGTSLKSQEVACRKLAVELGYRVEYVVYEDFSGAVPFRERPEGSRCWEDLTTGHVDAIIVHDVDRLTRTDADILTIGDAKQHGDGIRFVHGEVGGRYQKLLQSLRVLMGEQERADIIERTKRGKLNTWLEGNLGTRCAGNGPGYGMTWDSAAKRWGVDEEQAEVVRDIFRWYVGGDSMPTIAQRLNDAGILSPRGKRWAPTTLSDIIRSPKYRGAWPVARGKVVIASPTANVDEWPDADIVRREDFPQLVDESLWRKAQLTRKSRRAVPHGRHNHAPYRSLIRRMHCAECGMWFRTRHNPRAYGGRRIFSCIGRERSKSVKEGYRAEPCTNSRKPFVDDLLLDVEDALREVLSKPSTFGRAVRQYLADLTKRIETVERQVKPNRSRLTQLEGKLERLTRAYIDGRVQEAAYENEAKELEDEIRKLDTKSSEHRDLSSELRVLKNKEADLKLLVSLEEKDLRELAALALVGGVAQAIERLDVRLTIHEDRIELTGRFPDGIGEFSVDAQHRTTNVVTNANRLRRVDIRKE